MRICPTVVLVAYHHQRHTEVLSNVCTMPTSKNEQPKTLGEVTYTSHPHSTMGLNRNGLYRPIPRSKWIQLPMGSDLSINEHDPPNPGAHKCNGERIIVEVPQGSGPDARTTQNYRKR